MLKLGAFKIALIYIAASLLWIFLSDRLLFVFKNSISENTFVALNSGKGVLFVLLTGILLLFTIRKSNAEIIKNQERYLGLYESNPNPMWIYDPVTLRFISVNDSAIAVYGYSKEEFLSMTIKDIRPAEDQERLMQSIKQTDYLHKSGIWRHFKKDGTLMSVDVTSHRIIYSGKNAVITLIIDNTEIISHQEMMKKLNAELTDEKKRLSDIQELSKIAGWDYFVADNNLVFSDDMYRIFNLDNDNMEVHLSVFLKSIHRDDLDAFINAVKTTLSNETDMDVIHRLFLSKNDIRYIRELGKLEYRDGKPYKIRGTMQDITELKLIEREKDIIYNENKKLDNIITKINNMVVLVDTESRITWVNQTYEDFTGNMLAEVKGLKPSEFMIGDNNTEILQEINELQGCLEAFAVDMINYTKTQIPYWVNIEFTPMFEDGVFTGYITVHNNITTRKEKEEEITKQNIILRDIAWLSSHEIRRPVASILGLMELINANPNVEEKEEYIRLLNDCTIQLDQIIHHINDTINEKLPPAN